MSTVKLVRIVFSFLLIALGVTLPRHTQAAQITYFKAAHSSRCLDVANGSRDNGAKVQQYDCNSTNAQNWEIVYVDAGDRFKDQAGNYYKLINRNSGKCLEVGGWATHNGAQINQWDCHNGANQQWLLYNHFWSTGHKVTLYNRHSRKCADVPGWARGNNVGIVQWECSLAGNQQWFWNGIAGR